MTIARRTLLAAGLAAPALVPRARPPRPRLRSISRSRSAGRSPRSSTATRATSRRENRRASRCAPVYAGSYVDTLTKAQTAIKAGDGPPWRCCWRSMRHADRRQSDRAVRHASRRSAKAWLDQLLPGLPPTARSAATTWGMPFQRCTIVLFWNKAAFREAGLIPSRRPRPGPSTRAMARKADQDERRCGRALGRANPGTGFTYWLFRRWSPRPAARSPTPTARRSFDSPACQAALQLLDRPAGRSGASRRASSSGAPRRATSSKAGPAMIWTTTGNLSNIRANAKFPFGVAMLPRGMRRGSPTGGGNFHLFKAAPAGAAAGGAALPALGHQPGAGGAMGHRHRLRRDPPGRLGRRRA